VLEHADVIARVTPASSASATLRARLLVAEGKPEEAVKLLLTACELVTDRSACLRARALAAARVKAPGMLDAAVRDLLSLVCVATVECADTATWLAQLRQERGEPSMALGLLERAAREDPAKEDRWLRVADAAARAGQHVQALDALTKVADRRGGADAALQKRIEAERSQVLGGIIMPPR
jgi:predicted Zn-dependent protease